MNKINFFSAMLLLVAAVSCGRDYITYEQFGAKGDGRHDDTPAIVAAHEAANEKGLPVKAKDGATYYMEAGRQTAIIRTDTDWGKAKFIIDDNAVQLDTAAYPEGFRVPVFRVESAMEPYEIEGLEGGLKKGQKSLGVKLPCRSLVRLENDTHRVYIRKGENKNNGVPQQEMLVADADGNIEETSAIIWDYDRITKMEQEQTAYRKMQRNSLKERGIIMRALLALMNGVPESKEVSASEQEIQDYLVRQSHTDILD